jgi:hypothetical protein
MNTSSESNPLTTTYNYLHLAGFFMAGLGGPFARDVFQANIPLFLMFSFIGTRIANDSYAGHGSSEQAAGWKGAWQLLQPQVIATSVWLVGLVLAATVTRSRGFMSVYTSLALFLLGIAFWNAFLLIRRNRRTMLVVGSLLLLVIVLDLCGWLAGWRPAISVRDPSVTIPVAVAAAAVAVISFGVELWLRRRRTNERK